MTAAIRKLCLLGEPAVGKTAVLAALIGESPDSIEQHGLSLRAWKNSSGVDTVVWDSAAGNALDCLGQVFLTRADALVGVADATRPQTIESAMLLLREAAALIGARPAMLLLNKSDLAKSPPPETGGIAVHAVSALDPGSVHAAFEALIKG